MRLLRASRVLGLTGVVACMAGPTLAGCGGDDATLGLGGAGTTTTSGTTTGTATGTTTGTTSTGAGGSGGATTGTGGAGGHGGATTGTGGSGAAGGTGGAGGHGGAGAAGGTGGFGGFGGSGGSGGFGGSGGSGGSGGFGGSGGTTTTAAGGSGGMAPKDAGVDADAPADAGVDADAPKDAANDAYDLPDALPPLTDADLNPVSIIDGLPNPLPGVYSDMGAAPGSDLFRALIAFPIRDRAGLEAEVKAMYDPASPTFRQYQTPADWATAHAPYPADVQMVKLWLESVGFQVPVTASNRLLVEFTGTVAQFNAAFQTELHVFERKNPQVGNPPIDVYGTLGGLTVPTFVAARASGVITCDLAADPGPLPGEAGGVVVKAPGGQGKSPAQIAKAYGVQTLYAGGHHGQGQKLGVVVGATFKFKDLQSFWQSFGITRPDPIRVQTMEAPATRYTETTLDVEWSAAIADQAEVRVYEGPDARNTSMVYTFNEAIARGEVSVLTDSFAHREDSEPSAVRKQYDAAAIMAAALGITVVAASGDGGEPDTPSVSPYVTAVGGSQLSLDANGNVVGETAWSGSGSGASLTFGLPYWQNGIVLDSNKKRATVDFALNASPAAPYWVYFLATWKLYGGTSFSSPVAAGALTVANGWRAANGKPRMGYLNPLLYTSPDVQKAFRDITAGGTATHKAGPGWDYPTGWGAPDASALAAAVP